MGNTTYLIELYPRSAGGHEIRRVHTEPCNATWEQKADGLHIRAMFAQRLYTDCKWPNPIVIRITHAEPVTSAVAGVLQTQQTNKNCSASRSQSENVTAAAALMGSCCECPKLERIYPW
jgi:hypothetical protein